MVIIMKPSAALTNLKLRYILRLFLELSELQNLVYTLVSEFQLKVLYVFTQVGQTALCLAR
jgi:hypothetical protein